MLELPSLQSGSTPAVSLRMVHPVVRHECSDLVINFLTFVWSGRVNEECGARMSNRNLCQMRYFSPLESRMCWAIVRLVTLVIIFSGHWGSMTSITLGCKTIIYLQTPKQNW